MHTTKQNQVLRFSEVPDNELQFLICISGKRVNTPFALLKFANTNNLFALFANNK